MFKENPYYAKTDVNGHLVAVLRGVFEERGLQLIQPASRCVKKHEIHELILSCEPGACPGAAVNKIAYLGFAEIDQGGVITAGDDFFCGEKLAGTVAGFDETHAPNHLNIVIKCGKRESGQDRGLEPGEKISFRQTKEPFQKPD